MTGRRAPHATQLSHHTSSGARPTSLGGGRARLSAAAGAWGGGVSPPDLPLSGGSGFGADRRLRHACEGSSGSALAPLAVALDRSAVRGARLSGEGCPGGGRGQRPPLGEPGPRGSGGGGAAAAHWVPTRPPSTGAAAEMIVLGEDFRQGCRAMIVLGGCTGGGLPAGMPCGDCTWWMYWGRTSGRDAVR